MRDRKVIGTAGGSENNSDLEKEGNIRKEKFQFLSLNK